MFSKKKVSPLLYSFFPSQYHPKVDKWNNLRECSKDYPPSVGVRLEWIIFYEEISRLDVTKTCKYFDISRKTFYKWYNRFNESRHLVESLIDVSKSPHNKRVWEVTREEELNIIALRQELIRTGKDKLKRLYFKRYNKKITGWKIEIVIRKHNLFFDKKKHKQVILKKRRNKNKYLYKAKSLIHKLSKEDISNVWHIDGIILDWYGTGRVIFTALHQTSKIAYARVYNSKRSINAKDFLQRLMFIVNGNISVIHSDNGTEFEGVFNEVCSDLSIERIYSRPHTPKDNPSLERFNRTVQEEWLEISDVDLEDIPSSNLDLTNWLKFYNMERPHQTLDYATPIEYIESINLNAEVLPMYSAST